MEPNFCRCDCGEIAPEGKLYIRYHHNRDPQKRAKNSKTVMGNKNHFFGKTHSDKTKQLISDANTGRLVGEKSPHYGKHPSDETRRLIGKKTKERLQNKKYKNKWIKTIQKIDRKGINNPNWNGGSSFFPYCIEWTSWLKEQIKERDHFQCQNPNCYNVEDLCVHHIDYDKNNCSTNNLITLCRSCHCRANFNREHWIDFYNSLNFRFQKQI